MRLFSFSFSVFSVILFLFSFFLFSCNTAAAIRGVCALVCLPVCIWYVRI